MALSFNSIAHFHSRLQVKPQNISRHCSGACGRKTNCIATSMIPLFGSRKSIKDNRLGLFLLAADGNQVATDPTDKDSGKVERALTDDQLLAAKLPSINSSAENIQLKSSVKDELGTKIPEESNGVGITSEVKPTSARPQKRASLTAREKLRAARVLSRYTDSKPAKSEYGSRVLAALRESDGGKRRSGLPEAPTNLLDDSKRGMPKKGLTFNFPGGFDLFIILVSFVLISTTMFATTYIVWKLGAIHFNE